MKKKKAKKLLKNTIKWIIPVTRQAKVDFQNGCCPHNSVVEEATRRVKFEILMEVCKRLGIAFEQI